MVYSLQQAFPLNKRKDVYTSQTSFLCWKIATSSKKLCSRHCFITGQSLFVNWGKKAEVTTTTNQPPHLLIDYNELTYQTSTAVDMSEVVDPQKHTAAVWCMWCSYLDPSNSPLAASRILNKTRGLGVLIIQNASSAKTSKLPPPTDDMPRLHDSDKVTKIKTKENGFHW